MKKGLKFLLVIFALVLVTGCNKDNKVIDDNKDNKDNKDNIVDENKEKTVDDNKETKKDIIEPKLDELLYLGSNKSVGRINGKVGLYSSEGKEILKPEYDYIGYINDGSIQIVDFYVTIKGNEIKLYNKDMKEQKDLGNYSLISDSTNMIGVYKLDNNSRVSFYNVDDINSNDYFNYKGSDYKGEYGFIVLYPSREDSTSKSREPLILVINNKKLSKLNPSLIELKNDDNNDSTNVTKLFNFNQDKYGYIGFKINKDIIGLYDDYEKAYKELFVDSPIITDIGLV